MNPSIKRAKSAAASGAHAVSTASVVEYLKRHGVRSTSQRRAILDALLSSGEHVTIPAVLELVQKRHPRISYATVFRTMKLFSQRGLVRDHSFADGRTWYEMKKDGEEGHGHLLCIVCSKIVEFHEPALSALVSRAAQALSFVLTHQHHLLYGVCPGCRARRLGSA